MPSFSGEKNQNDPIRTEGGVVFQSSQRNFWNSRTSRRNCEIPALLQGGTICLVSLVKVSE